MAALVVVAVGAVSYWIGPLDHGFPPPRPQTLVERSYWESGRG